MGQLARQSSMKKARPLLVKTIDTDNKSLTGGTTAEDIEVKSAEFAQTSKDKDESIRLSSPYGSLRTWRLLKIIVKSNDDIRQESFAM